MLFIFSSCAVDKKTTAKEQINHHNNMKTYEALLVEKKAQHDAVSSYIQSLPEMERIAQLFLVNIQGDKTFVPVETPVPGGCLFFSYNIASSAKEIISFTNSIADYCDKHSLVRPYLAVDQEGGLVNRLRGITSALPSNSRVSAILSSAEARVLYETQAAQLYELGFSMNLAPVSEVCMASNEAFLAGRSYGSVSQTVSYSAIAITAYEANRVGTVVKHFPGNTNVDPHTGLPEITLSQEDMERYILQPFSSILNFAPSAVLMSHARTAAYDGGTPSCLSKYWVTDTIRNTMHYDGLVISDDIFMAALEKNGFPPEEAAVKAIEAGVDVIMLSEKRYIPTAQVLLNHAKENPAFAQKLLEAEEHVISYKIKCGILSLTDDSGVNEATASARSYTVTARPVAKQYGTDAARLARFQNAYTKGTELYIEKFSKTK